MGLICERIISDRRGAIVALLRGDKSRYVLKFSSHDTMVTSEQFRAIKREGAILSELGQAADNLLITSGEQGGKAWLLTTWAGERTASTVAKSYRLTLTAEEAQVKVTSLSILLCSTLE